MEGTTQLFMPRVAEDETGEYRRLGDALLSGLEAAGLPSNRTYGIVENWQDVTSIEWVRRTHGAPSFLYEIHNGYLWFDPERHKPEDVKLPVLSREDILRSVWHGITGMLAAMA